MTNDMTSTSKPDPAAEPLALRPSDLLGVVPERATCPTPQELRDYAQDADEHGNKWVPLPPTTLRALAAYMDGMQRAWSEDSNSKALTIARVRAMIADDACAMTYQTMGQYRSALLQALKA